MKNLLNNKRIINGWAFYDWANSAYFLVISTAIFPSYFLSYTPDKIPFLGLEIANSAFYSLIVSLAYLVIAFVSPILSGVADYGGRRMFFLKTFTVVGAMACMALFYFKSESTMWIGVISFIVATIGCAGGLVFYDSYLPDIASEDMYDRVSAKGYTYGYIGSVLLLVFILFMAMSPSTFGIFDEVLPYRIGFVLVGFWWISFSQFTFKRMPRFKEKTKITSDILNNGFLEIRKAWDKLKTQPNIRLFLISFFFYFSGVQTVIYLATAFAKKVLDFQSTELITIIIILQIIAIPGAYLFAYLAKLWSNKRSIMLMIGIWIVICGVAYVVTDKLTFYILSGFLGLVLGGIQSMSRSTYSKLLDKNEKDLTCYFSFYDVLYKLSVVFGTALFAIMEIVTNNIRFSVLGLSVLFLIGLILFQRIKFDGIEE